MILTQKHDGGPGHGSGYLAGGGSYVSYVSKDDADFSLVIEKVAPHSAGCGFSAQARQRKKSTSSLLRSFAVPQYCTASSAPRVCLELSSMVPTPPARACNVHQCFNAALQHRTSTVHASTPRFVRSP